MTRTFTDGVDVPAPIGEARSCTRSAGPQGRSDSGPLAGYEHFEEDVEQYTPYLPAFSAAVLCVMGLGFVLGLL